VRLLSVRYVSRQGCIRSILFFNTNNLAKAARVQRENPEDPKHPEDLYDPEIPENPKDPKRPEDPDDPEIPENPKDPKRPEDPDDPEIPEILEDPKHPEDPPKSPEGPLGTGGPSSGSAKDDAAKHAAQAPKIRDIDNDKKQSRIEELESKVKELESKLIRQGPPQ
jgi:hypothetical protein